MRKYDRWDGAVRQDVPRFYELLRTGLVKTTSVFTSMNGHSNYYIGFGNEIGYDAAHGYSSSISMHGDGVRRKQRPGHRQHQRLPAVRPRVRGQRCSRRQVLVGHAMARRAVPRQRGSNPVARQRQLDGRNDDRPILPQAGLSLRRKHDRFAPNGTNFLTASQQTGAKGAVAFFNDGTTGVHFDHSTGAGTGSVVGSGLELQANYGTFLPDTIPSDRSFDLTSSTNIPPEFSLTPYSADPAHEELGITGDQYKEKIERKRDG